jgi:hypothetical protein
MLDREPPRSGMLAGHLNLLLSIAIRVPRRKCACMLTWGNNVAGILLAKLWDWHLASFVQ